MSEQNPLLSALSSEDARQWHPVLPWKSVNVHSCSTDFESMSVVSLGTA